MANSTRYMSTRKRCSVGKGGEVTGAAATGADRGGGGGRIEMMRSPFRRGRRSMQLETSTVEQRLLSTEVEEASQMAQSLSSSSSAHVSAPPKPPRSFLTTATNTDGGKGMKELLPVAKEGLV